MYNNYNDTELYNYVDINAVGIGGYYESMATDGEV